MDQAMAIRAIRSYTNMELVSTPRQLKAETLIFYNPIQRDGYGIYARSGYARRLQPGGARLGSGGMYQLNPRKSRYDIISSKDNGLSRYTYPNDYEMLVKLVVRAWMMRTTDFVSAKLFK